MKRTILYFLLLSSVFCYGQAETTQKQIGIYDPSFWKKELKLDRFQYVRMCEINREFYDRLIEAFHILKNDRRAFRNAFAQCWVNRNSQLLQTMNARQQKKWNKIMADKYHIENTQISADRRASVDVYHVDE
jgi:inner membrane protein involved in colicin E2 resistance